MPITQGFLYIGATCAAWLPKPPYSVAMAEAIENKGSHSGMVEREINIYPD